MSTKLCEIIAVANSKKKESNEDLTKLYQGLSKTELLEGFSRSYHPVDEEGEKLPDENKILQTNVETLLDKVRSIMSGVFDLVATQDNGNTLAKADVVVDGVTVLKNVPVATLLYLDKNLNDLHTTFSKLPVLPPSLNWKFDTNRGCYVSDPVKTVRTKKVPFRFVKTEATEKFPAQVDVMHEDKIIGEYTKTEFNGALSFEDKNELVNKVRLLRDAVVKARERANQIEVTNVQVGKAIFDYLFS